MLRAILAAAFGLCAGLAAAQPIALSPAAPQPEAADLRPGLSVRYHYPPDIRQLSEARRVWDGSSTPGAPLVGFDYPDTDGPALTSPAATKVVALIEGFMRFDAAGPHRLEFHSNDGLEVTLGGAVVYAHDGRHPCETDGYVDVSVPAPGWYAVRATYFQRMGTNCLMLRWAPPGADMAWAPTDIYARAR